MKQDIVDILMSIRTYDTLNTTNEGDRMYGFMRIGLTAGRRSWSAGVLCLAVLTSAVTPAFAKAKLAPHRAIYDITLARTATAAGIVELTGRMVYELTGDACRGYKQAMRFVTRSTDRSGKPSIMDLRSSFWEDGSGATFRFETDQYRDEKLTESSAGDASRDAAGTTVAVKIRQPDKKDFKIEKDVMFPVQHSAELLNAALAGKTIYTSDLYDGSEKGTKVYVTTAVLGKRNEGGHNATLARVENAEALDGLASWPVSLSYFDPEKGGTDTLPTYELAFLFFENGVSRRLVIDYGHFAIRGKLTKLEMLKAAACDK
ncbi:MAG: cell envelope integrity EipB family protein [Hyphomicrobiaceae bacterium]